MSLPQLSISLSLLSILLATPIALLALYGLIRSEEFKGHLTAFPRSNSWGYLLMGISTVWFLYLVKIEDISDFESYKRFMMFGFAGIGIGTTFFVRDLLAARGAAVLMLLVAKLMVDTARWIDTDARLAIVVWAYVMVIAGMWFTISPWRMRDFLFWLSKRDRRLKGALCLLLTWSGFILVLAFSLYRTASASA